MIEKILKWDSFQGMVEWCDTNAAIKAFTQVFEAMVAEYNSSGESEATFTGMVINDDLPQDVEVTIELMLHDDSADPYVMLKGFREGENTAGLMQYLEDKPENHIRDAAVIIADFFRKEAVKEQKKRG